MTVLGVHCLLGSFLMPKRRKIKNMRFSLKFSTCSDKHTLTHTQCYSDVISKPMMFEFGNMCRAAEVKGRRTVVVGDDVQTVEQLSLVFVDSLDLNVEHGVGVDLHLVVLLQVHRELQLVFLECQNIDFIT